MFINFLVNLLHLGEYDGTCDYALWYESTGSLLGVILPFASSLVFVLLFYYVWSRFKALNTFHWLVAGFVNLLVTFILNLFIGKVFLADYIVSLGDEYQDLWYNVATWPFTADLWVFATNGIFWALVFFFVLSLILKRWSSIYNIPFGRKFKKSMN